MQTSQPFNQPLNQPFNRLLLACQFDRTTALAQLDLVIAWAQPLSVSLSLLIAEPDWLFCDPRFNPELQIARSNLRQLVATLADFKFDAALIFTQPQFSPYSLAYFCYLADIPIRVGQSSEFGGGLLSHPVQPPLDAVSSTDHHLHLLRSVQQAQPFALS